MAQQAASAGARERSRTPEKQLPAAASVGPASSWTVVVGPQGVVGPAAADSPDWHYAEPYGSVSVRDPAMGSRDTRRPAWIRHCTSQNLKMLRERWERQVEGTTLVEVLEGTPLPGVLHRCAGADCPFLVAKPSQMGGWCCKRCAVNNLFYKDYGWRLWAEGETYRHGPLCDCRRAEGDGALPPLDWWEARNKPPKVMPHEFENWEESPHPDLQIRKLDLMFQRARIPPPWVPDPAVAHTAG